MSEGQQWTEAQRRRLLVVLLGAVVAVAAVVGVIALLGAGGDDGPEGFASGEAPALVEQDLKAAVHAAGCKLEHPRSEGDKEITGRASYRADPPHSGSHWSEPAYDDAYPGEPPATEAVVHSLYHGRVAIWFDPALPDGDKGDLKALFDEDTRHVLLVARESMDAEVAATAWTESLTCPEMGPRVFDALRAFRDEYRDKGPELVP